MLWFSPDHWPSFGYEQHQSKGAPTFKAASVSRHVAQGEDYATVGNTDNNLARKVRANSARRFCMLSKTRAPQFVFLMAMSVQASASEYTFCIKRKYKNALKVLSLRMLQSVSTYQFSAFKFTNEFIHPQHSKNAQTNPVYHAQSYHEKGG